MKWYNKIKRFRQRGFTEEEYTAMLVKQRNRCDICRAPFGSVTPHIDHDHSTGKVRGLLCCRCNNVLGMSGDDPKVLKNAIRYLKRHEVSEENECL
jgi:tRNA G26 N,N-dimethylase Trm1